MCKENENYIELTSNSILNLVNLYKIYWKTLLNRHSLNIILEEYNGLVYEEIVKVSKKIICLEVCIKENIPYKTHLNEIDYVSEILGSIFIPDVEIRTYGQAE